MIERENGRVLKILLVEDNDNDVILTREAFRRAGIAVDLIHVENGRECMDYLRKSGRHPDASRPDLILLDLNMPVMNGHEVLRELADDADLRHLPVVILTTSKREKDILDRYELRCSSYIVKSVSFDEFVRDVRKIKDWWLTLAELPPTDPKPK